MSAWLLDQLAMLVPVWGLLGWWLWRTRRDHRRRMAGYDREATAWQAERAAAAEQRRADAARLSAFEQARAEWEAEQARELAATE